MSIRLHRLRRRGGSQEGGRRAGQEGAAAVEFALCLPVLLLLIAAIVDFGHAYYMSQVISNASREGARYGVRYKVNSATGLPFAPSALPTSISNYVTQPPPTGLGYVDLLGSDADLSVTPSGVGYTSNNPGDPLTVTVTADKHWFFLGGLLRFPNPKKLQASTTMTLER
jgi:Flp pilus assembly protein TadG